jgi:aerobic-type carbon monoxide dehydrogenase small subunit (CoxS/CutS family)
MAESQLLSFRLNGQIVDVAAPPHYTLLEVLRYCLDLIGTKQGCDKGDCGACAVQLDGLPVCSCITLAAAVQGREVRTVEGLSWMAEARPSGADASAPAGLARGGPGPADAAARMHPLQDSFDRHVAAQCGFCTPGILMSAEAYLRQVGRPVSRDEAAAALAGNLCRCTGYTKILDAVVEASEVLAGAAAAAGKERSRG